MTSVVLIGWIWAIYWSVLTIQKARSADTALPDTQYNRANVAAGGFNQAQPNRGGFASGQQIGGNYSQYGNLDN